VLVFVASALDAAVVLQRQLLEVWATRMMLNRVFNTI
jgi:hypothetical protein